MSKEMLFLCDVYDDWLDKHLDDCPFDWYEGLNDGEIVFILEEED